MRWIAITPADRFRRLVVVPDVATDLPGEVGHGREDPAREEVPFDLGKPEFDLVEPGGIRRREVQVHVRMVEQERADRLGLMRGQVVRDDVNLTALRLRGQDVAKEFDKRRARVPRYGLAQHLAGLRVERGEQREGSMAVVLEPVPLRAARRQGQDRIEAVERLNGRFLIDRETAAWSGGFTYNPITSAALVSKSGSSDCM